jgi:hypothetical protein
MRALQKKGAGAFRPYRGSIDVGMTDGRRIGTFIPVLFLERHAQRLSVCYRDGAIVEGRAVSG